MEKKDLNRKCEEKYYNDLRALVYEFEIHKIAIYTKEIRLLLLLANCTKS
jgi:hypothetical protein